MEVSEKIKELRRSAESARRHGRHSTAERKNREADELEASCTSSDPMDHQGDTCPVHESPVEQVLATIARKERDEDAYHMGEEW